MATAGSLNCAESSTTTSPHSACTRWRYGIQGQLGPGSVRFAGCSCPWPTMCCQSRGIPRSRVTSHTSVADASIWDAGKPACDANPACSIPTVKSLLCTPFSPQSCRRLSAQSYSAAMCHARVPISAGLRRVRAEQRRRSPDVRRGVAATGLDRDPGERGAALERRPTERHHPEYRRTPGELFPTLDHLPTRLHPADRLEQRRRHVKLGAGSLEHGVERRRPGDGRCPLRRDPRHARRGTGLDGRCAAGSDENDERRLEPRRHGLRRTSTTTRAGPVSSDTRNGDAAATPSTHSTCPSKSHTSFISLTAGSPSARSRSTGAGLPCSSCARAGSNRTTR